MNEFTKRGSHTGTLKWPINLGGMQGNMKSGNDNKSNREMDKRMNMDKQGAFKW